MMIYNADNHPNAHPNRQDIKVRKDKYSRRGIFHSISQKLPSHLRALAVAVMMVLCGNVAYGQTTLSGNINWTTTTATTTTNGITYQLAECDHTYTITKLDNYTNSWLWGEENAQNKDVTNSKMTFRPPADAQGCHIEITLSNAGLGCHTSLAGFGTDYKDKVSLSGGSANREWSPNSSVNWGYHSWSQPGSITYTGNTNTPVTVTFTNSDSDKESSFTISVKCTGCCNLDAEIEFGP